MRTDEQPATIEFAADMRVVAGVVLANGVEMTIAEALAPGGVLAMFVVESGALSIFLSEERVGRYVDDDIPVVVVFASEADAVQLMSLLPNGPGRLQ
jgi:hypothetical protein